MSGEFRKLSRLCRSQSGDQTLLREVVEKRNLRVDPAESGALGIRISFQEMLMKRRAGLSWDDFISEDLALAATSFAQAMSAADRPDGAPRTHQIR